MVAEQRNSRPEVNDRVVCAEVIRPQEGLLAQFDRGREEPEHRPEYRELEQHREAATHRVYSGALVNIHHSLLLLEGIFLLWIFLIELVNLRLDCLHLRRGRV